jgi:hypothetical protein
MPQPEDAAGNGSWQAAGAVFIPDSKWFTDATLSAQIREIEISLYASPRRQAIEAK